VDQTQKSDPLARRVQRNLLNIEGFWLAKRSLRNLTLN